MAGGPGDSTNTITNMPWTGARPYVLEAYKQGLKALNATNSVRYTGRFFANPNTLFNQVEARLDKTTDDFNDSLADYRRYTEQIADGRFLTANNPYINDFSKDVIARLRRELERFIIPQIRDVMISNGAVGGASQDLLERQALEDFDEKALEATLRLYYDNYALERKQQFTIPDLLLGYHKLLDAAQTNVILKQQLRREHDQIELDEALQHHIDKMEAEWRGIGEFAHVVFGGGFSQRKSIEPVNALASGLKGAIGAAGTGAAIYSVFGTGTGTAAASAAGAAGAAGAATAAGTAATAAFPPAGAVIGALALAGGLAGVAGG